MPIIGMVFKAGADAGLDFRTIVRQRNEESVKMAEQFERHGVPHIPRPIDNAEHTFTDADPAQLARAYRTMHEFMIRHLEPESGA